MRHQGDCIKIFRHPKSRLFYAVAFSEDGQEYMWRSPTYRWLWTARLHAVKAARAYIQTSLANRLQQPQAPVFIQQVDL